MKLFNSEVVKHAAEEVRLTFIQQETDKKDLRYVKLQGEIPQKVWARGTLGNKIGVPAGAIQDPRVMTTEDGGRELPAFKVFDWRTPFDCAVIAHITPNGQPLNSVSSMAGGSSSLKDRTSSAIAEANKQISNACTFMEAPGIVFILPSEDHADDEAIAMAAYGDLTVPIDRGTHEHGEPFYGRNGVLRPDKNTHISAIIRLRRRKGPGTYFPNPFAKNFIDEKASIFTGLQRANVKL